MLTQKSIKKAVARKDNSFFLKYQMKLYFTKYPFALASFKQAVMPFLVTFLIASVETLSVIHLSSSGI